MGYGRVAGVSLPYGNMAALLDVVLGLDLILHDSLVYYAVASKRLHAHQVQLKVCNNQGEK